MLEDGCLQKIAAISAREEGDARRAIDLLYRVCMIGEEQDRPVDLEMVNEAYDTMEKDKTVNIVRALTKHQKVVLLSAYMCNGRNSKNNNGKIFTGDIYEEYKEVCNIVGMNPLTQRRVSDFIGDLDLYGMLSSRVISKGRLGRTREISVSSVGKTKLAIIQSLKENLEYNRT